MKRGQPVVSNEPADGGPPPAAAAALAARPAADWAVGYGEAVAAIACLFVLALGVRTLTTEDLGYHLAYGDYLLDTGHIVDTSRFVDPAVMPAHPRYDLPPGAWYDASGTYRFPNANWLSQAVVAGVHRLAGMAAAAACRRWGHLMILAAMMATTLSMRRNVAPGAMVIVPVEPAEWINRNQPVGRLWWTTTAPPTSCTSPAPLPACRRQAGTATCRC